MKDRIAKLEGHAEHLLDAFLGLRMTYAVLAPLIENESVVLRLAAGARREGFEALRYTLFSSCALDVVKLALDDDGRAPSINNLIRTTSDSTVASALGVRYARHPLPRRPGDEAKEDLLRQVDAERERELGERFDARLQETRNQWTEFQARSWCAGFQTLRDKHTAHLELHLVNGKYEALDIANLGLQWADVGDAVGRMATIVRNLNILIRADFDMASAVEQFRESGERFWS